MQGRNRALIGALVLGVYCARAAALDQIDATVDAGAQHTDNLLRSNTGQQSANIATSTGRLLLLEQTRTLYADVDAAGTLRSVPSGAGGDSFLPSIDAYGRWTVSPDQLMWAVRENLGTVVNNANGGLFETGQQRLQVFATGPDVRLGGSTNALLLHARYTAVNYQVSPDDTERYSGDAGWGHLFGGGEGRLMVGRARTKAKQTGIASTIDSALVGYLATGQRGTVDANAGVGRLRSATTGASAQGLNADVRLVRDFSASSSVTFDFVRRFADTADVFQRQQGLQADTNVVTNLQPTDQPLRETAVDLSYGWLGRRTSANVTISHYDDHQYVHQGTGLSLITGLPLPSGVSANRKGTSVAVGGGFAITPRLTLSAAVDRLEWSDDVDTSALSTAMKLGLTWQMTNRLGAIITAERFSQSATIATYTEVRYYAGVQLHLTRDSVTLRRAGLDTAVRRRVQQGR